MEYYTEEGTSSLNNESDASELQYDGELGEEEYCRYRKEQIFQEIDFMKRKTKIAATLGPSSCDVDQIVKLFDAGMSIARFNMSHGTAKMNAQLIRKYIEAKRLRPYKTCATMMDLKGRSVRISQIQDPNGLTFTCGQKFDIRTDSYEMPSSQEELQINLSEVPSVMQEGDIIIIGDNGQLTASVTDVRKQSFQCVVNQSGTIPSGAVVKIPGNRIQQLPILTQEDKVDIQEIASKNNFDYLIVPQVLSGRDIQEVKNAMVDMPHTRVVAKIDTKEGIQNFEGILKQADGIVILRNELGMEILAEKLMIAQKWMTQQANLASVPVFLQSQVLESMVSNNLKGARAETMDVSAAVMEGADAFILSHETSVGLLPVDATVLLAKSIAEAENVYDHQKVFQELRDIAKEQGANGSVTDMLCTTATQIALENNVDLFVVLTQNGQIARTLAKQRPIQTILACCTQQQVVRQVNTSRGVIGYKVPVYIRKQQDSLISLVLKVAKEQGFCLPGNKVMIFTGENEGETNETVTFKMIEVEQE